MKTFIAATAVLLLSLSAAHAQTVDPARPFSVVSALQGLGYKAQLETDSTGDPLIRSAISGTNYSIWFYGCSDNQNCTGMNFSAGYDLTNGMTQAAANQWNLEKLVGRVYVDDEGDPFIDHFVVAKGGISGEVFQRIIQRWDIALSQFEDFINW